MDTLLEIKDLKKYFPTPKGLLHAVDGISFQVERGETLGIVGESGCGKSTLGRVCLHLLDSTGGQIIFEGKDVTQVGKHELHELRRDMQMIFQDPYSSLNPRMNVSSIIGEPLLIHKMCSSKEEFAKRVKETMDVVGLAPRTAYLYPHELDGGRRQRIGIARAIIMDPKLIVCDEPVSALDVSIQAQILNLLQELQRERKLTYMFVTHNLSVVKHISNNIAVLYLGTMAEKASSQDLFANPLHPYTKALLSAIPIAKAGAKRERIILKGEITSPINVEDRCRFAPRCLYATELCASQNPVLEEVMPNHFVACHHVREINNLK